MRYTSAQEIIDEITVAARPAPVPEARPTPVPEQKQTKKKNKSTNTPEDEIPTDLDTYNHSDTLRPINSNSGNHSRPDAVLPGQPPPKKQRIKGEQAVTSGSARKRRERTKKAIANKATVPEYAAYLGRKKK